MEYNLAKDDGHAAESSPASWRMIGGLVAYALTTLIILNVLSVVIDSIQVS